MNPKTMKPGDAVSVAFIDGKIRRAVFVGRAPGQYFRFHVPDFAGLGGPDNAGICALPESAVRARVRRAEAEA